MMMNALMHLQPWLLLLLIASKCNADSGSRGYSSADTGSSSSIFSSTNQETRVLANASVSITIENPFIEPAASATSRPKDTPPPTTASTKPVKVPQTPPPTATATEEATVQTSSPPPPPPPPPPPNATLPPTAGPTVSPSVTAVMRATDAPSNETWTNDPTTPPSEESITATDAAVVTYAPTTAPTVYTTLAASLVTSTPSPASVNLTTASIEQTATEELVAKVRAIRNQTVFTTSFSLWSSQSNTSNLQARVLRSLAIMFCEPLSNEALLEAQGGVCVFVDGDVVDVSGNKSNRESSSSSSSSSSSNMLEDGSVVESVLEAPTEDELLLGNLNPSATILRLSMDQPVQKAAGSLSWSVWEVSWVVVRLGSLLAEQAVMETQQKEQYAGSGDAIFKVNVMNVYNEAVANLEDDFAVEMDSNIVDGSFDHLINTVTYAGSLAVSSLVGEEKVTFGPFSAASNSPAQDSENPTDDRKKNNDDDSDTELYVGLFFAGLGIGFVAIMVFLWFACKPRIEEFFGSARASNHKSPDDLLDVTDGQTSQGESRDTRETTTETTHKIIVIDSMESITSNGEVDNEFAVGTRSQDDDAASSSPHSIAGTTSVAQSVAYSGVWSVASME